MAKRGSKQVAEPESVLKHGDNADLGKEVLSDDEHDDLDKAVGKVKGSKAAKAKTSKVNVATPSAASGSSASSSSGGGAAESKADTHPSTRPAATSKKPLPASAGEGRYYTIEEVNSFLPQGVLGCTVTTETVWHKRFRGRYPGMVLVSKSFGGKVSEREALIFVLAAIWHMHEAKTGQSCPWDLVS